MADPDWSELPKDLLQLISQKLDSYFYQLRFRSVCSSWRSSSVPKNHLLNLPSKLKLPFDSNNNNNNAPTFPISKRPILLITPPPNQQQTLNPWLIKIGPDSHGRTRLCHPLLRDKQFPLCFPQHIDFNQLSVHDLGHKFIIDDLLSESGSTAGDHFNSFIIKKVVFSDTLHNGNHLCSVLLTIHISGKPSVFRLDEKEKKWVELTNLGDRVLFLGENCAFSVSASDLGMENGNCVIFIDEVHLLLDSTELGISVFCLDKRQILPLSDFPFCSKLFWPPPQWVGLC